MKRTTAVKVGLRSCANLIGAIENLDCTFQSVTNDNKAFNTRDLCRATPCGFHLGGPFLPSSEVPLTSGDEVTTSEMLGTLFCLIFLQI